MLYKFTCVWRNFGRDANIMGKPLFVIYVTLSGKLKTKSEILQLDVKDKNNTVPA